MEGIRGGAESILNESAGGDGPVISISAAVGRVSVEAEPFDQSVLKARRKK
jgi:hypothetical protein